MKIYYNYYCQNPDCNNVWTGNQKKPRCTKCKKYKVIGTPTENQPKNIIIENETKIEETPAVSKKEIFEEPVYTEINFDENSKENLSDSEKTFYNCGDCGYNEIEFGSKYCLGCGESLDIDWSSLK